MTMHHLIYLINGCYGDKGEKIMVWPTENLWRILKEMIYEGGRQITSKQQLWEAIVTQIQAETVQTLTSSTDAGLVKLLSNQWSC